MTRKAGTALATNLVALPDRAVDVPDATLVAAARGGSASAKEALFRRHLSKTHGFAFRLLGSDEDLHDVVQESLAVALESFTTLRDPSVFSTWLGGIVVNTVRRTLRRRRLLTRLGLRPQVQVTADALVSSSAPPDVAVELSNLYRVISGLPETHRIALVLRRVEGYSIPEIARLMSKSTSSVKRWVDSGDRAIGVAGRVAKERN